MKIKEYQEKALETAIYPNKGNNHIYPFLGLCGEFGEFYKTSSINNYKSLNEINLSKYELGDCYWYFVVLCWELNIDLDMLAFVEIDMDNKEINLEAVFLHLSELAELFKKVIRDNTEINKEIVLEKLSLIFICIFKYMVWRDWDEYQIWQMNIDKLQSRKERNVIHGSGDER